MIRCARKACYIFSQYCFHNYLQTNSDGHLIVLGAAQILKSIVTGSAKRRTNESAEAVEQYV